jgi:hypothetical protein
MVAEQEGNAQPPSVDAGTSINLSNAALLAHESGETEAPIAVDGGERSIFAELFTPSMNDVETLQEAERFRSMYGDFDVIAGDNVRMPQSNCPAYSTCIVRLETLSSIFTDYSIDLVWPEDYDEIPEGVREVAKKIIRGLAGEVATVMLISEACIALNPCNPKKYPAYVGPLPSSKGMDRLFEAINLPPYATREP